MCVRVGDSDKGSKRLSSEPAIVMSEVQMYPIILEMPNMCHTCQGELHKGMDQAQDRCMLPTANLVYYSHLVSPLILNSQILNMELQYLMLSLLVQSKLILIQSFINYNPITPILIMHILCLICIDVRMHIMSLFRLSIDVFTNNSV